MRALPAGWTLYVLRCADGTLYTGTTTDLARRLAEHAAGHGAAYTRGRRPVRLAFQEAHPDRPSAQRREAAIKRLSRREKRSLISGASAKATTTRRRATRRRPRDPATALAPR